MPSDAEVNIYEQFLQLSPENQLGFVNRLAIEPLKDLFKQIRPEEEASRFISMLPSEKRIWLRAVPSNSLACLQQTEEDSIFLAPLVDNTDLPTYDEACHLYKMLFSFISSTVKAAEGKPIQLLLGETHNNRTSLLIEVMLQDISERLGINHLGVEIFPEGTVYRTGDKKTILGLDRLLEEIRNTKGQLSEINETGSTMPEGARKNIEFLIQRAIQKGIFPFSADPKGDRIYRDETSPEDTGPYRDIPMTEVLQGTVRGSGAIGFNPEKDSCMALYGFTHINEKIGSPPEDKISGEIDVHRVYMDLTQVLCFLRSKKYTYKPQSELAAALPLSEENAGEFARMSHPPVAQVIVNGKVETAAQAIAIAEQIDHELGDELQARHEKNLDNIVRGSWADRLLNSAEPALFGERSCKPVKGTLMRENAVDWVSSTSKNPSSGFERK